MGNYHPFRSCQITAARALPQNTTLRARPDRQHCPAAGHSTTDWITDLPLRLAQRFKPALPACCHLCGRLHAGAVDLCRDCATELPLLHSACVRCALPLEPGHDSPDDHQPTCGKCQVKPPAFATAHAVLRFGYPVNRLVQRFKFERDLAVGRMLGEIFANAVLEHVPENPDMLLAVPLHRNRERERGFNQSRLLAGYIARRTNILLLDRMVIRCRDTSEQSGLKAVQRRANLKGAFEVTGDVRHAHIAIIDDVMTTGTTLNELAATLLAQGASRVDAWVLARTPQR